MLDGVKEQLHPSNPLVHVVALALGILWLRRRSGRGPRRYFTLLLSAYWFLASRVGASILREPLAPQRARIVAADAAPGVDAVVLLGGGS